MIRLMQQGITARAEMQPDAVALAFKDARMTYGALEESSSRLARLLGSAGCRRGDRVALLMPKTPMAIVAMLGVLKADAIYVPLDPGGPPARLARMLEASDCRCLLAAGPVETMLLDTIGMAQLEQAPAIGWLDPTPCEMAAAFSLPDLAAFPATAPPCRNDESDVAHILFTSGSTGTPKGVMVSHRSVVHFVRWAMAYFGTAPADRISQHPPLHFDLSTFDIFCTLWAGAELHLVPAELNLLPHKLGEFIRDARLTQWFSVPSVLSLMAQHDVLATGDWTGLKRVLWCGEAISTPALIYCMRRLPHARFTNLYGPTEATIASSYYTLPRCPTDERAAIPIGTACDGEELLVLDDRLRPVATGEIGHLYIRGVGLSPGYWRDPEKTRSVFLQCPGQADSNERIYMTGDLARVADDGLVHFLGRADSQIKSRGYRIELGEIEAAANATGCLRECAVVAIASAGFEGHAICCAFVPLPGGPFTPAQLREKLKALLPGYMLPSYWEAWETLPRNANGKIDRRVLRERFLHPEKEPACLTA